MAYKSKRTRDLQGEVQAGTNVSVVKTTKPDGTNVYTLSAEGGETIGNSTALFDVGTTTIIEDGSAYCMPVGFGTTSIQSIGDFYQEVETQFILDETNAYGIKFLQSGLYRISTTLELDIETTTTITSPFYLKVIHIYPEGGYDDLRFYKNLPNQVTTTKYSCVFNVDTIIEVNSNDVISFIIENYDSNTETIYTQAENQLYIQKIR